MNAAAAKSARRPLVGAETAASVSCLMYLKISESVTSSYSLRLLAYKHEYLIGETCSLTKRRSIEARDRNKVPPIILVFPAILIHEYQSHTGSATDRCMHARQYSSYVSW
jgi:hypothetical protein